MSGANSYYYLTGKYSHKQLSLMQIILVSILFITMFNINFLVILIAVLVILVMGYFFWKQPHECLIVYFVFILFQGLIVENISRKSAMIGEMLHKADEVFILLFFFIALFNRILIDRKLIKTNIEFPLAGILIIGLLSSIIAEVPLIIMSSQFFLLIKGFMIFYILASLPMSEPVLKKYIKVFFVVSLLIFILGIVDFAYPEKFRLLIGNRLDIFWRAGFPSVQSIFTHPGAFGWFMSFIGLYAFAFTLVFDKFKYLFIGLVFSIGSFLSMRRKALLGLFIGVLIGLLLSPVIKKIKLKYILILILIGILLIVPLWSSIETMFGNLIENYIKPEDSMLVARNALYITGAKIAKDYFPLGAGLGRYGSWMSRAYYSPVYYKYGLSDVPGLSPNDSRYMNDTFWPMIIGELGVFGLLFYVWIIIYLISIVLKQTRLSSPGYIQCFYLGTFMILLESLVESIGQPIYTGPPQCYFIFASVGMVFALKRGEKVSFG